MFDKKPFLQPIINYRLQIYKTKDIIVKQLNGFTQERHKRTQADK